MAGITQEEIHKGNNNNNNNNDEDEISYPLYLEKKNGVKVQIGKGSFIPGIFLNELSAKRAYAKSLGMRRSSAKLRGKKDGTK